MPDTSSTDPGAEKSFEDFDQDNIHFSGDKGMRPVPNHAMINFLRWIRRYHPEVRSLQQLSEYQLFQLVSTFEGSNIEWAQWRASFTLLFEGRSNKEGYEDARTTLRQLDL